MKRKKRDQYYYYYCYKDSSNIKGGGVTSSSNIFYGLRQLIIFGIHGHGLLSLISVFTGCLLLIFAAFSLLVPPPVDTRHLIHLHSSLNDGGVVESNLDAETRFRVPSSGGSLGRDLWSSSLANLYYGCSNATKKFQEANVKTHHNRYLLIATSGGLNQQRTGITDAVVAAYILNATLVVPKLDQKSFWKDSSDFAEIFDVDRFISFLSKDVKIIKELPTNERKVATPYHMRVPRKCTPKCYQTRVLPVLNKKHVVQLSKFDYRLSNKLDTDLQKLRCRVNYHALQFTEPILEMGQKLVERMRMKTKHFITIHLRFEPDMLAFSGCYYGGGDKERTELGAMRKRWKTLHASNPEKVRRHGRCPLTPEEVGLMLRALGFGSDVHIYVASGEVYGGEETLVPLKALFPNFHTKETITSKEELTPFSTFSSRMAALDFIVCDASDVFVTNNNGNMARILAGRRRYFGHKPTIRPNAKKLYKLFMTRNNMTWEEFASSVRANQVGFMGEPNEMKPGRGEFHENPSSCICGDSDAKGKQVSAAQNQTHDNQNIGNVNDEQSIEGDQDLLDMDYVENGKELPNETDMDNILLVKPDQSEEEELFSD
ncbi:O-FucT domain-containing protein [Cephalotus follicularis]|uniref:O-fucosyltransferase family protein n=1 Tax=Cephalotus follicularis TaxID=3775 RepID=A0A1Q3CZ59_CEPFO|nr:O-FucT domain-containing protein [Cephalotus follicularis]